MVEQEELKRRLNNVENIVAGHRASINILEITMASEKVRNENIGKDVADIKDTLKWLVRLILTSLIVAIIGFLVNGGFSLV